MTGALQTTQSENAMLRRELAEARALFCCRKSRKTGQRVALQGKFVFSMQGVFEIAKQAEMNSAAKRSRKKSRTAAIDAELSAGEEEVLEAVCDDPESDRIIVAGSRAF